VPPGQLDRDGGRASSDVQHFVARARGDPRDEEAPPARILAEAEEGGVPVVGLRQRREELPCPSVQLSLRLSHVSIVAAVGLDEELSAVAGVAEAFLDAGEKLAGVVVAEPAPGLRLYLCAYRREDALSWLALDRRGRPVDDRALVRDTVSIVGLCELAEESAGGGDIPALRRRLADLRGRENPDGIAEAEEAAAALESTIAAAPRLASLTYLDEIGAAASRLERTLGEVGSSPFARAMSSGTAAVDELARDVERNYKRPLG
jgi:hypothetical protein